MKNVAFVLYRDWAFDIFKAVQSAIERGEYQGVAMPLLITTPEHEFTLPVNSSFEVVIIPGKDQAALQETLLRHHIDTACFYGWSWIVKEPILSDYTCLCLHPSPLPRYRGGSPIQHQLVAGETQSAVSIIKMSEGIDDGDIYIQIPILFTGYLSEILDRMIAAGIAGTSQYLSDLMEGKVIFTPQVGLTENPPLKRRTPADGEISLARVGSAEYVELYNLVRGLQKPYPNAFITFRKGILYIEKIQYTSDVLSETQVIDENTESIETLPVTFRVKDGFTVVTSGRFEVASE